MEKTYIGAIIADIHFGAMSATSLFNELDKGFIKYINKLKTLDYVVIAGDLFDTKLSLNSDHVKYLFLFFKKLIEICSKKNTKLRILKGTASHDNNQLDILRYFSNSDVDFKIIEKVSEEELFPDVNVLYIPEEYMTDKKDYYKDFFNNKYDMVFGHGLFAEVAFVAKNQESEITMSKAPVFKSSTIIDITKGPIFFGHIHKSQCIKDKIYYVGSYSRWVYGEEEPKGFMMCYYTPETTYSYVYFIENKDAPLYNTMVIDYNNNFFKEGDQTKQLDYVLNIVKSLNSERLRLIFNIPEDYENPTLLSNMINDMFLKYKNIKVVINNNSKDKRKKKEMEEKIKTLLTKYDFIFDKGLLIEDKLSKYVKIKYNKDINTETMRDYLYTRVTTK